MSLIYVGSTIFIIIVIISIACLHSNNKLAATFYQKQYIGHARHQGPYPENSLPLYQYLVNILHYNIIEGDVVFTSDGYPILNHSVEVHAYNDGMPCSININKITLKALKSYSIQPHTYFPLTTVEEFIIFGKQCNVCIMLDLTFQHYTFSHLKSLYNIVKTHNMRNHTIWGDVNVFKLACLDRGLICQIGGSWGRKLLIEALFKSFFCKQVIMSFNYYGGNIETFRNIVHYGHRLGFIMKTATINDLYTANRFWNIGTDLINTDILQNNENK